MHFQSKPSSSLVVSKNFSLATRACIKFNSVHQTTRKFIIQATLAALSFLLILALPAMACGGSRGISGFQFSLHVFSLSAIASLYSYGIPLLFIVPIEALILHKRESLPYWKAFLIAVAANGFYLCATLFNHLVYSLLFPITLVGSVLSASMCLSFCQRAGFLKRLSQRMFVALMYLCFIGLGFATSFLSESIEISAPPTLLYLVTIGLILIGFIFSFVAKGFAINLILKQKRPSLASTVMSMQVASFPIIAIAYYFAPKFYL